MVSRYKDFEIHVYSDSVYTYNSADNITSYFKVYVDNDKHYPTNIKYGIKIFKNDDLISSAIICESGSITGIFDKSFIIKNDALFICCSNMIYCLNVPDLDFKWKCELDHDTCLEIYAFQEDFIIHGELQISRVTEDATLKWQYNRNDIPRFSDSNSCLQIANGFIKISNVEGYEIVLDEKGKEVSNLQAKRS